MLSSVLNSERAILVNIAIMRTFVEFREMLSLHKELAAKLQELEQRIEGPPARPEHRRWVTTVEQHLYLGGQLIEEALDVEAVARSVRERGAQSR